MKILMSDILRMKDAIDALMALSSKADGEEIHQAKMKAIQGDISAKYLMMQIGLMEAEVVS